MQGEPLGDYPFVYLVTAPRFLGYSFNPVSFWYLYDQRKNLKAMILEVNNTFDERRMYLLKGSEMPPPEEAVNELVPTPGYKTWKQELEGTAGDADASKFTDSWSKDFHVSPFNSRKGSYGLSAYNPLSQGMINNTITLSSSKGHPKLVARIFSIGDSVDPSTLGRLDILKFFLAWWWVGFVTFPRIAREAAKLFFRRGLHVWYRPEILRESIGRRETEDEKYDSYNHFYM